MWRPVLFLVCLVIFDACDAKLIFTESNDLRKNLEELREDWSILTSLGRLDCDSDDGNPTAIKQIKDGKNFLVLRPLELSYTNIYIISNTTIDYELVVSGENQQNNKKLTITCENLVTNQQEDWDGYFVIYDVNDNEPIFSRTNVTYQTRIPEVLTDEVPLQIHPPLGVDDFEGKIIVTDEDGVDNNKIVAVCQEMEVNGFNISCDGFFSVKEQKLGEGRYQINVYALRQNYIDFEAFTLRIQAVNIPNVDTEPIKVSLTQNVLILIQDIQNMPPFINKNGLVLEMYENTQVGSLVDEGQFFEAFDLDTGDPNAIYFELLRNVDEPYAFDNNKFYLGTIFLDGTTYITQLYLNNTIDREAIENPTKTVYVDIEAIEYDPLERPDRNEMISRETISIKILDVNDQVPTFRQSYYHISIPELSRDPTPNTFSQISNTIEIVVEDKDSSDYNSFTVDIVAGNANDMFKLNKRQGSEEEAFVLYMKEDFLDYETQPNEYILTLRAVDDDIAVYTSETIINITISDANDHSPEYNQTIVVINVFEDTQPGTQVGQIYATDKDSGVFGEIVAYQFIESDNLFFIDDDGAIFLNGELDYESRKSYLYTAEAIDGGGRVGRISVSVVVGNVIDVGPRFEFDEYYSTLLEDSKALIPSITIRATSREDDSQTVEYFVESILPDTIPLSTFSVNRSSGLLTVNNFINYKQTQNGIVQVTLKAVSGQLSSTANAIITITDLNNFAPVFIPSNVYDASVNELAESGFEVITLTVEDGDDPDTKNGQVTFLMESGANDDFKVLSDSGIIIVAETAQFDIERRQSSYMLTVVARDKGNPVKSATATVYISLIDNNNKDPVFVEPLYTFGINESVPIGTEVGSVSATDVDSTSILRYRIDYSSVVFVSNDPINLDASTIFTIDDESGLITVAGIIDRLSYERVSFKVGVEDINVNVTRYPRQTASASVVVFIRAAVDPQIYFQAPWTKENPVITKTYSETDRVNYQVLALTATDPVVPETVQTYRKVNASDPNNNFYIDGRLLYMKNKLDYEALEGTFVKKISVVVEAISTDRERTGTATIEVIVQDINDNAPEFEQASYTFYVAEDKVYPFSIGQIKATDKDSSSYGQVTYSLGGSNSEDFYTYTPIGDNRAVIIVNENATLDYETQKVYNLLMFATDNPGTNKNVKFTSSVPVEIYISDKNDMVPEFEEQLYNFSIIGTQQVGGDVGFVLAEDGDAGANGEVLYDIVNSTNNGMVYFDIATEAETSATVGEVLNTGRIFVKASLENLPDRSVFELYISARDTGEKPHLIGYSRVRILVNKGVQDLTPKWDINMAPRAEIPENKPIGYSVATMIAHPADSDSGIIYSFLGAGDSFRDYDNFDIDPDTGLITSAVVFDHEAKKTYNGSEPHKLEYSLLILAVDSQNSTLTNQFLLTVDVTDEDDNTPSFLDCDFVKYNIPELATVYEELPAGKFVFKAQACDLDSYPFNGVKYAWFIDDTYCLPQNLQQFELDEYSGVITTKVRLDREFRSEFLLCVEAIKSEDVRKKRDITSELRLNRDNHDSVLYILVTVLDINDLGPKFIRPSVKTVILKYPETDVSVAEAYDDDLPPNDGIRYSIDSIKFVIDGKTQNAPIAFVVNGRDGTISIGTNDYSDYIGGYFDITVRAEDYNGANVESDTQLQRVYVTDDSNRIRVVINRAADEGVYQDAREMIERLNALDDDVFYEIKTISYHVTSNNEDPRFDKTDICMVVVQENSVLSSVSASKLLNDVSKVQSILEDYGAVDPGPCDPAISVYPIGWESYWWVLVAFAIFIFVCCLILIFIICVLYKQYKQYMESRQTYLVPGN